MRVRYDYQRFQTGLAVCRGFIPLRQGGFTRAPGTLFKGYTRNNARARLIPFEFARDDAVVLEFTAGRMRVWRYGALIMDGGSPYELETPYSLAAIDRLQWVQSADVIYFCDGLQPVQKLSRFALDNWTIAPLALDRGPFRVQNLDEDLTIQCSAATGTITLTASEDFFVADHVGSLLRLEGEDYSDIALWSGNTSVTVGDVMRYGANIYELTAGTDTGVNPPVHTSGVQKYDFEDGTSWKFLSDGIGIVRITAIDSPTSATAEVIEAVPAPCVSSPTYRFSEGAWSGRFGHPAAIEIHDQRLVAAATASDPRTVWFSAAGAFDDFEPSSEADGSFGYAIAGRSSVNRILWLRSGARALHIGALGEEYSTRSTSGEQGIGPTTATFGRDSSIGSADATPIAPAGNPIFIARDGARLFEIDYSLQRDANRPRELSLPSDHIGASGFRDIVWQSSPQQMAWLRLGNADLALMIYDPDQDVLGWATVPVAGGEVESVTVSADPTGAVDVVDLVVRRVVDGQVVRMFEQQSLTYGILTGTQALSEANHLFAAADITADPAIDTFSVPHLAGQTVTAWTDQGQFPDLTVAGDGSIVLPEKVGHAFIGLFDDTHQVETLPVQAPARDGNSLGRRKRLHSGLGLQVHRSAAGKVQAVERDAGQPDRVGQAQGILPRKVAAELVTTYSGPCEIPVPSGHAGEVFYRFRPDGGAPLTILASVPVVEEAGG
nr:hypothetical protein [Oceaniglobus trochenteri]